MVVHSFDRGKRVLEISSPETEYGEEVKSKKKYNNVEGKKVAAGHRTLEQNHVHPPIDALRRFYYVLSFLELNNFLNHLFTSGKKSAEFQELEGERDGI